MILRAGEIQPRSTSCLLRTAFAAAAVALALLPGTTTADQLSTRTEYVDRLEAICKPDVEATERATQGAREDIRREHLRVAAAKLSKGARIFAGTVSGMAPIPRPEADLDRLKTWFRLLNREELWLRRISVALQEERRIRAQRFLDRFIHAGTLANNVVIAFGFDYCSFRFSRFG